MKDKVFERKTQLLEAALDEFCAKSFEDASLNTIIKNAGISKGTYYYHFADKQALYLFLLDSSTKAKWDFINERLRDNKEASDIVNIFQKFKFQARLGAEFACTHPKYHKLGRMLTKEQGSPIYTAAKNFLEIDSESILAEMIEDAIAQGEIRVGIPREFLIKTLSYFFSSFDEIFNSEEDYELERMLKNLDMYVDIIQNGIGN